MESGKIQYGNKKKQQSNFSQDILTTTSISFMVIWHISQCYLVLSLCSPSTCA